VTERTIRSLAKDLAGQFYDSVRSAETNITKVQIEQRGRVLLQIDPVAFGKTFPTLKDYLEGTRHGVTRHDWEHGTVTHVDDGKIYHDVPGWAHWYDMARQLLVQMLNDPNTHANLKQAIMDALLEDREKQLKQEEAGQQPVSIPQRHHIGPREH
jgi:hypothetical protein